MNILIFLRDIIKIIYLRFFKYYSLNNHIYFKKYKHILINIKIFYYLIKNELSS